MTGILLIGLGLVAAAAIVAYLALLRPDIPWASLEAKYANAQSRWMDLPGGLHVHYRDEGDPAGPSVVLVHGYSASLHTWARWVELLGRDYRIVSLDLPGHGLTRAPPGYAATIVGYADLVDAVAGALKLGPYVVVGNSMGGAVAWTDALRHPKDVRALVLVDSAGWPSKARADDGPLIFRLMGNPLGRALLRNLDNRAFAKSGLEDAYLDKALVTPSLVDRYVDLSRAPGHREILLTISEGAPVTAAAFQAIHAPTLVMHGEKDRLIPVDNGRGFAEAIPGAKLIVYPGVGHVPMEQIPERSAADVAAFLAGLPRAAPARPPPVLEPVAGAAGASPVHP